MRARQPDQQGHVVRDGVKVGYETFADERRDGPTVVFVPIDTIVHSRAWKGQVPYLAQHFRVVTIDPRGNGRSDRPTDPAAYGDLNFVADTVAVLDATGVDRAVLVGVCGSAWQALLCAHLHPDRVQGVVAVAPWILDDTPPYPYRLEAVERFEDELEAYEGWSTCNRHVYESNWPAFPRFFFDQVFCEPHSTKQLEDVVGYACETTGEVMVAEQRADGYKVSRAEAEEMPVSYTHLTLPTN